MKFGLAVTVFTAALALTACGSSNGVPITDAQQAAQAAFGAGQAGNQQQALLAQLMDRASASGSVSVNCPKGGSVSVSIDVSGSSTSASFSYKLSFNGCVTGQAKDKNGKIDNVTTDGDVTYAINTDTTGSGGLFSFVLNGHLDFSGAIDDSLDINNLSYSITSDTSGTGTSVSIVVTGDITTGSGHSFHYDGTQTYNFDGTISASGNP